MDATQTVLTPFPVYSDRAWFDPALVNANLYLRQTDVDSPAADPVQVVNPDPYRWAVGFTLKPQSGTGATVAPWGDLVAGQGYVLSHDRIDWFDLTRYGPFVSAAWYATGGAGSVVRVLEVVRRTRG